MNLLVVGGDTKGAWQMRGVQLGAALGARVTAKPGSDDWAWADLVVLVKRAAMMWAREASRVRVPVIWDALDFWAQPEQNTVTRDEAIASALKIARAAGVSRIIGATQQMASDLGGDYLPHHGRAGLVPTPPRKGPAKVVGYDGNKKYLGRYLMALEQACQKRGLTFVVNPPDLSAVDALVAFRDGRWDGWICREWKSGVKYSNAILAGRPILTHGCAAFGEMAAVGTAIDAVDELTSGLQSVTRKATRDAAYENGRAHAETYTLPTIASAYAERLNNLLRRAA